MAFTSQYVLNEISRATPKKYWMMTDLIDKYVQSILGFEKNVLTLADVYVKSGIVPGKYLSDAQHIAVAAVNKIDFVVSYNLGHIVKLKTMIGTGFANLYHGYHQIGLCTPTAKNQR